MFVQFYSFITFTRKRVKIEEKNISYDVATSIPFSLTFQLNNLIDALHREFCSDSTFVLFTTIFHLAKS